MGEKKLSTPDVCKAGTVRRKPNLLMLSSLKFKGFK